MVNIASWPRPQAVVVALGLTPPAAALGADPASDDPVERGAYVYHAAGCAGCHTNRDGNGAELAGGVAIETAYGTFHAPNISPHPEHGIGGWSDEDLLRALREGRAPDGTVYFPAFPYTSYTRMADRDILDLAAFLRDQEAVDEPNRPHELRAPYGWRFLLPVWRLLYFEDDSFEPDPARSDSWNRGAYLVEALGHCAECHTPRNFLGAMDESRRFAGTADGPEGQAVPNITPHPETGIGRWSAGDLTFFLDLGMMPDGDFAGGRMATVIRETTSRLTPADRAAMAEYLLSLPPIEHAVAADG